MRGLGSVYQRGLVWWVRYQHDGREYRETSRSVDRNDAVRLLQHRLAALNTGKPGGRSEEERLTFEDLAADYIQDREVHGATGACLQWSKSRVPTAQQKKMKSCKAQAGDEKGDERKAFMSDCLKAGAPAAPMTQPDKMKVCNTKAATRRVTSGRHS